MSEISIKNKNPFIYRQFKIRFIRKFLWRIVLTAIFCSLVFFLYSSSPLGNSYTHVLTKIHTFDLNLQNLIVSIALPTLIVASLCAWIFTLIKSNKIAGPAYRTEETLKTIGKYDFSTHVTFRRGDAIKQLPDDFNDAFEEINSILWEFKGNLSDIKKELTMLTIEHTSPSEQLLTAIKNAKTSLSRFKTE